MEPMLMASTATRLSGLTMIIWVRAHGFVTTVPEPSTMVLAALGLLGLAASRRRVRLTPDSGLPIHSGKKD